MQREDKSEGRGWNDAATNLGMPEPPEAGRSKAESFPRVFGGSVVLTTP